MIEIFIFLFFSIFYCFGSNINVPNECLYGSDRFEKKYLAETANLEEKLIPVLLIAMNNDPRWREPWKAAVEWTADDAEKIFAGAVNTAFRPEAVQFDVSYRLEEAPGQAMDDDTMVEWIQNNWQYFGDSPALKIFIVANNTGGGFSLLHDVADPSPPFWNGMQIIRANMRPNLMIPTLIKHMGASLGLQDVYAATCDQREFKSTWTGGDGVLDTKPVPRFATAGCRLADSFSSKHKECPKDRNPVRKSYSDDPDAIGNWMNGGQCSYERGQFTRQQIARMRCVADSVFGNIQLNASANSLLATHDLQDQSEPSFISPALDSLHHIGGFLGVKLSPIAKKAIVNDSPVRVGLVPLAAAVALHSLGHEQKTRKNWLLPYLIFEGSLAELEEKQQLVIEYLELEWGSDGHRVPYVTKGKYVLVMENAGQLSFSSRFHVTFLLCRAPPFYDSEYGVCTTEVECGSRPNAEFIPGYHAERCNFENGRHMMACCYSKERNIQRDGSDLWAMAAAAQPGTTDIQLPDLPRPGAAPLSTITLNLKGAGFIGTLTHLSFSVHHAFATMALTWNDFDSVLKAALRAAGASEEIRYDQTPEDYARLCRKYNVQRQCFGLESDGPYPKNSLEGLTLHPFGKSVLGNSTVDLLALALDPTSSNGHADANRKTLQSWESGTLLFHWPATLAEGTYFIVQRVQAYGATIERTSAPFELNYAPCTGLGGLGTCRPRDDCPTKSTTWKGCPEFQAPIRCCLGDPLAVDGYYRQQELGAAEPSSAPLPIIIIAVIGTAVCFLLLLGAILFAFVMKARRQRQQRQSTRRRRQGTAAGRFSFPHELESKGRKSNRRSSHQYNNRSSSRDSYKF